MHESLTLTGVDKEIYNYLDLNNPKSFLLFAGAGSGKTRTLVNVLQAVRGNNIQEFVRKGQRVAVITYTNAACNEIQHRLAYDPIFAVSTIHSFVWELIQPFTQDIKAWLRVELQREIDDLEYKLSRARDLQGKTALQNARRKKSKEKRLSQLDDIKQFTYSPITHRVDLGSLTHSEVIKIATYFLMSSSLFRSVLVNKFPILLIDESQDTEKALLEAFIFTQSLNDKVFSLGLFGDLMQRIYSGGKEDLGQPLPEGWMAPIKESNFRSPKRIVSLINTIRKDGDGHQQVPDDNAEEGFIRLFIVESSCSKKPEIEASVRNRMKELTNDAAWTQRDGVKVLTLEHAMAASRGQFDAFFTPLSKVDSLRDPLLNGTSGVFKFLSDQLLALSDAVLAENNFAVMAILKRHSKLVSASYNIEFSNDPLLVLKQTNDAVDRLKSLLMEEEPNIRDVLKFVHDNSLLVLPEILSALLVEGKDDDEEEKAPQIAAWELAILAPINQLKSYSLYINEKLGYGTHQGVKGLEFDRVMAIIDDEDANGFLFSYEKLFGAKPLSSTDSRNESTGTESVLSRTRRLLYVICSRAEKSLAVVAYTQNPSMVKKTSIDAGWFREDEIEEFLE
ncbi:TPA: ATP-dependent helicase [Vibrio parahaemolyticus]|uniref:UvrD-helicase domain-containing protein n=1 Tax=Vibrio parahaemolyticus TaxID=670 RepID=UPI000421EB06|nr:UvrD-helicase domain-containing protein [Vibrio parahaemolyticus]EGQ9887701.1 ATP-dependent helicase [Vibrio parahaemolyticus]KYY57741.1 ATP-dependent DNA helicase [Vibrio parahaemolyticus]MCX8826056.1 UvrD-helicase domain-containing protein [Vibrio parahaemolyticus]MCX8929384.1 UvrD-helicase domain-containing protein [Vibrio parahaemolyticus]OKY45739.1 ATP-dependent DNA helicase [Vibrio parahaemolyticus]